MTTSKYHTGTVFPLTAYSFKVQNLRKMRNFGHNFLIFAHCYIDIKAN